MKKLMIAAAVAAMIGGAEARELAYDFCASMKTTTAKSSSQSTTYSYYFGFAKNPEGKYWWSYIYAEGGVLVWDASSIYASWVNEQGEVIAANLIKRDSKTGKGTIQSSVWNKLTQEQKLKFVDDFKAFGNYFYDDQPAEKSVTDPSYQDPGFTGVKEIYRGKEQWCLSIKWSNKITTTSCYRVAGSTKLVAQYIVDDCCNPEYPDGVWKPNYGYTKTSPSWIFQEQTEGYGDYLYCIEMNPILNYRFGALTRDKATKVEFVAQIGEVKQDDVSTKLPQLTIAGQGSVAEVKDKNGRKSTEICSISGNIVGVWIDPVCEVCCGNSGDALVFDCAWNQGLWSGSADPLAEEPDGGYDSKNIKAAGSHVRADNVAEPIWGHGWIDYTDLETGIDHNLWGTAAYGTFTLKFNSKDSNFIY